MIFKLQRYIFIIPLLFSVILIFKYMFERKDIFKFKSIEEIQENDKTKAKLGIVKFYCKKAFDNIGKYCSPPKKSKLYKLYKQFLRFTRFNVENYFAMRIIIVIISLVFLVLIRYTNIAVYTEEIFNNYEYRMDIIYEQDDKLVNNQEALNQEIYFLKIAINEISCKEVNDEKLKGDTMNRIRNIIVDKSMELELPSYTVANKVYYRLKDYYSVRDTNYIMYLYLIIIFFLIFDGVVFIYNVFAKANAKIELRFLKKLIVLNGNFQDIGFTEILSLLINKSKYYKKALKEIATVNDKNTVENKLVYREIMLNIKDEDAKLFFEKLEQANNSDFEHAIKNIEEEEKLAEEERKIKVNSRVEAIHSFGVVGAFIIIYLLANYLLLPWLQAHDISAYY